jgi:membrane protein implicated in regulation of membrane protease activity
MDGDSSVVGRTGVLTVGTRGAAGPGEVLVKIRGGSEAYLAWSDQPLPRGTTVLVVEARGARALTVVVWSGSSTADPRPAAS